MANGEILKTNMGLESRLIGRWFDELQLYAAPTCNMLCNFCSKGSDCITNGNNPMFLSRPMTPRQAVNWAISAASKDKRIKVIKISGPGEPLCNRQTFEVFKRLQPKLPDHIFGISTNGLLLKEKTDELEQVGVRLVDISVNAIHDEVIQKLYSKLIVDGNIIALSDDLAKTLRIRQMYGISKCIAHNMTVKINTVYFPGINDEEIPAIAEQYRELGAASMCIISGCPGGKLTKMRLPSIADMILMQQKVSKFFPEVQIKTFMT